MANGPNFRIRVCALVGTLLIAAAGRAESGTETAQPEVLPSKNAARFLIKNAPPAYPIIAKMNYIQGKVSVQALVGNGGEVTEAHVLKGHPFLAVAALKAVRKWLFKPAHNRQGPPNFMTYVDVNFSLQMRTRRFKAYPDRPEVDLDKQIQPPELLEKVPAHDSGKTVRMRVLVGPDGKAIDSITLGATPEELQEARRVLTTWSFRPAHWGALAVPWYMDVDVPVESLPTAGRLLDPGVQ